MVVRVVREGVKVGFLAKRAADRNKGFTALAGSGVLVPEHVANEGKAVVANAHDYEIGQMVEDKGAYVGIWRPVDRGGRKLNAEFNVFAAPKDTRFLTNTKSGKLATYNDDIKRIAGLRNICGHDGIMLANDTAIYDAVRTGNHAALAKWHMPVKELVNGRNIDGEDVQPDNLYAHKDKGALKGTFTDKVGSDLAHWYWTASEHRGNPSLVYDVVFSDGDDVWVLKDVGGLSSRPVRLVYRGPANQEWLLAA
jgi:hypothetical protein